MAKHIVAFAGKKESGKDTTARFLTGIKLCQAGLIDAFQLDEEGNLFVPIEPPADAPDDYEVQFGQLKLDPGRNNGLHLYLAGNVWPFAHKICFADPLKEILLDIFNVPEEALYGTNEQKNAKLRYDKNQLPRLSGFDADYLTTQARCDSLVVSQQDSDSTVTVRSFMQYLGTEVFRKIDDTVWVDTLLRRLEESQTELAIVTDARFPNEIKALKDAGAIIIHLKRNVHGDKDRHTSETLLDTIDPALYDLEVDNGNLTVKETNELIEAFLIERGVL